MISRLILFAQRFLRAQQHRLLFLGTSYFKVPQSFRFGSKTVPYRTPCEPNNAYDFINLLFDYEYGLRSLQEPPRTILDIGANSGLFSLLAHQTFPSATIHAYEPNPRTHPFALENLRATSAQLFQAGIGSRSGHAEMIDTSDTTLAQTRLDESGSITIVSLREALARFPEGEIDLLKIDCEGAEWDIFQDPEPFKKVKAIRMEYHLTGNHTLAEFYATTKALGFTTEKLIENRGFGIAWLARATCRGAGQKS